MWWHDITPYWLKRAIWPAHQMEDLAADHSHTRTADLLLTNWATGKRAAFGIPVTSLLNILTLMGAGMSAGSAALATEDRKHRTNDAKCNELGWLCCVPLVTETYGARGKRAISWPLGLLPYQADPSQQYCLKYTAG